ncbi:ATP-binding protein [Telluribacter humicola]|uniref:ATP-binding protein n=1 Tax=Telluribacter humicola TaxID=1720261 RepID=UPI001A9650E3|nr:ATP-binding protein [Telluribacter humicola]
MIERALRTVLQKRWDSGKILIVLGPRQVGKTTLLEEMCRTGGDYLFFNGDDFDTQAILANMGEVRLRQLIGSHHTVFIDEAQRIPEVGLLLKLIHDRIKGVRVVVSGSSALELSSSVSEPLTGRKWEHYLYPISWNELVGHAGYLAARQQLEPRLVYGMYPEVINSLGDEEAVLRQIASSYLYKDLLNYHGIRKPEMLSKLLVALALQVGSEVSYNELANLLRIDRNTVEQYIGLLEQAFVVFRLPPFSRNVRNEISSSRKVYFYDNGIRNAIINNFNPLALRNDTGALWENFLISERMKRNEYAGAYGKRYFWRTHAQQEIDYLEEYGGGLHAYEFKWNPQAKARFSRTFTDAYPDATTQVISRDNFEEFLG